MNLEKFAKTKWITLNNGQMRERAEVDSRRVASYLEYRVAPSPRRCCVKPPGKEALMAK